MITRNIVVLFALAFLATLGYGIMIPTLSVHAHSHGASHADIGVMISAFAAAQLLTQIPMGRLSDWIGRVYMVVSVLPSWRWPPRFTISQAASVHSCCCRRSPV